MCVCSGRLPPDQGSLVKKSLAMSYSPTPLQGSTIGAGGLNFRVRNGNGWIPSAIVTRLTTHSCIDSIILLMPNCVSTILIEFEWKGSE